MEQLSSDELLYLRLPIERLSELEILLRIKKRRKLCENDAIKSKITLKKARECKSTRKISNALNLIKEQITKEVAGFEWHDSGNSHSLGQGWTGLDILSSTPPLYGKRDEKSMSKYVQVCPKESDSLLLPCFECKADGPCQFTNQKGRPLCDKCANKDNEDDKGYSEEAQKQRRPG